MGVAKISSSPENRLEADAPLMEWASIARVRPNPKNPRTHSKKQIKQIAASIRKFGFLNPLIVDDENTILAGHGRLEAARLEGMERVPIVRSGQLSEAQKRAYLLADNKIALNAGWDEELLGLELKELMSTEEFSVDVTGFSIAEVDQLIDGLAPQEPGDPADDALSDLGQTSARCRLGDIWRMGPHRLICGSALDPKVVSGLMNGEKAEMVFSDPPYNVAIAGNVSPRPTTADDTAANSRRKAGEALGLAAFLSPSLAAMLTHAPHRLAPMQGGDS